MLCHAVKQNADSRANTCSLSRPSLVCQPLSWVWRERCRRAQGIPQVNQDGGVKGKVQRALVDMNILLSKKQPFVNRDFEPKPAVKLREAEGYRTRLQ